MARLLFTMILLFHIYLLLGGLIIMPTKRPAAVVMSRPAVRVSASTPKSHVAAKSPMKASGVAAARGKTSSGMGSRKQPPGKRSKLASSQAVVTLDHASGYAEEDDEAEGSRKLEA